MTNDQQKETSFHDLGITPKLVYHLDSLKFLIPTPIQRESIPNSLKGNDILGIAQTGTGKTLAFGIPMIDKISRKNGVGLILVPTRELAEQVNETMKKLCKPFNYKTTVLIGGASIGNQIRDLRRKPKVIIATPGRIVDLIDRREILLFDVNILVLDEADRMLDMGFAEPLEKILKNIPNKRQTMLFSATMPPKIANLSRKYMHHPIKVEVASAGATADKISQEIYIIQNDDKKKLLCKLLDIYDGSVLVFTRTKMRARILTRQLISINHKVAEIHADRTQAQRRTALAGFKSGKYRILVATDVAARGIDVNDIKLVVNFDLPDDSESYVHRIGRTARAGKDGHAITFCTKDQGNDVKDIEKLINIKIPIAHHPDIRSDKFDFSLKSAVKQASRGGGVNKRTRKASGIGKKKSSAENKGKKHFSKNKKSANKNYSPSSKRKSFKKSR